MYVCTFMDMHYHTHTHILYFFLNHTSDTNIYADINVLKDVK